MSRLGHAVARLFNHPRHYIIVVGCDPRLKSLITGLAEIGKDVSLIKPVTSELAKASVSPGVSVIHSNTLGAVALERAGAKAAQCLVAATPDSDQNVSICREAHERFGVPLVIARMKLVEGVTNWARLNDTGLNRMSWGDTVRAILGETAPSISLSRLASLSDREQIGALEVLSPVFIGRKISDLQLGDCEVAGLTRRDVPLVGFEFAELSLGDVLTVIGEKSAIGKARETLASL
jgi:Trk K+ transport system NAD-binding subunit